MGEEAGYISPTRHLSICLAVGWLEEGIEEKGRKDGRGWRGGYKKRGRIRKRNEDRGGERKEGEGRKKRGREEEEDYVGRK